MQTLSIYQQTPRLMSVLRFTFPTVIMMVFASMYGIIDGIFLSNFIGSKALSANNIVYPLITVMMAVNLMFATGSNAIIAKKMGEGKQREANRFLSLVVLTALISLVRTLVLRCGALILFPVLWGIDGVWLAVPVAEVFAAVLAGSLIFGLGKKYGYINFLKIREKTSNNFLKIREERV